MKLDDLLNRMVEDGRNRIGGLNQIAEMIYTEEINLVDIDSEMSLAEDALSRYGAELDKEVAFDQTLKNEEQRRLRRQELRHGDANYLKIEEQLKLAQRNKKVAQINLTRLKNLFTVEKLRFQFNLAQLNNLEAIQVPSVLQPNEDIEREFNIGE